MEIKRKPYETTGFVSGSGFGKPIGGYDYKAPDGTLWNVDTVEGNAVRLWTINAWSQTHWQSVNIYEFERTWTRYSTDQPKEKEVTKRLSWRTKSDQFYKSMGCGQVHVIRYMGTCESCVRSVYSHGCAGERLCGDVVEASSDPRGIIPPQHCMNRYHAKEYDMIGRDIVTCYDCAQTGDKYRSIMAAAKTTGTWKPMEQI